MFDISYSRSPQLKQQMDWEESYFIYGPSCKQLLGLLSRVILIFSIVISGGYYTVLIKFGLRLVSLNTVYYYTNNRLTQNLEDPAGQFVWLDAVLTNASVVKEKVPFIKPLLIYQFTGLYWVTKLYGCFLVFRVLERAGKWENGQQKSFISHWKVYSLALCENPIGKFGKSILSGN